MLEKAADTILSSDTIYLYAKGAAVSMAELLKFRLNRFGKKVIRLPAGSSELFEYMNFFTEKDLVILCRRSRKHSKEAAVILDYQKKIHYKCIFSQVVCITRWSRRQSSRCSSSGASRRNIIPCSSGRSARCPCSNAGSKAGCNIF